MKDMNKYLIELTERRPNLKDLVPEIEKVCSLIIESYKKDGKVLLCGNGGSCGDADHIVGELMKSFALPRPLNHELKEKITALGESHLADKLQTPLRAINLSTASALSTAFANDVDRDYVFAQIALGYTDPGDVFFGISTSGNSMNVQYAATTAKALGAYTVGLTGAGGGKMRESGIYDIILSVPEDITHFVQEEHIAVYHAICLCIEEEIFGGKNL